MSFAQSIRNRLALSSGPIGTNRLLWGGAAGLVLLIGGGIVWAEIDRFSPDATRLQKESATQNGTGLSGVDNNPYRQDKIIKQEAAQANRPVDYPNNVVSIPSIESSYLDQQRAKRDAVSEQNAIRTQPKNGAPPAPARQTPINSGMMLGYIVAMNATMAAMTNASGTSENFKSAEMEKWQADALKASQAASKTETPGSRDGASSQRKAKHCLGLGGLKVMAIPKLAATMEPDSPQTPAEVEMTTGPLTGYRMAGEVQKHGDTLTVALNTLYHEKGDLPVDAILVSPLTQETTVASSVDRHLAARIGGPALAGAFQGAGQAAQLSGSSFAAGPFGGAASYSQFNPLQIGGMMAGGAAAGAQSVLHDVLPKGSTVTLSTADAVAVYFRKEVCLPD